MSILARAAVLVLLVSGIVLPEALGLIADDYSSASNYLSELGALGAPFNATINYFGFLPVGLMILVLVGLLWRRLPRNGLVNVGLICLLGLSIGYLGAFFFPCDPGCPATGTARQAIHNLAGLTGYLGSVVGLFALYFGIRQPLSGMLPTATLLCACWVTLSVLLMFNPNLDAVRGAAQRFADYPIFIWLSFAALVPLKFSNSNS